MPHTGRHPSEPNRSLIRLARADGCPPDRYLELNAVESPVCMAGHKADHILAAEFLTYFGKYCPEIRIRSEIDVTATGGSHKSHDVSRQAFTSPWVAKANGR